VPVVSTQEMNHAGVAALSANGCYTEDLSDSGKCHTAMLAVSPGADLLDRIVYALRDSAIIINSEGGDVSGIYAILDELGVSND
jgi:hypothetical protein